MADHIVRSPSPGQDATATGIQRPPATPALRNRQLARASTFSEGTLQSTTPLAPRRRESLLSNTSLDDLHYSFRSSTDNLVRPGDDRMDKLTSDEPEGSHWHSLPMTFVLLPAFAGLIWSNGSTVASDMMVLSLASIFLYWCTRLPWDWYKAAQAMPIIEPIDSIDPDPGANSTIFEEENDVENDEPQPLRKEEENEPSKENDLTRPANPQREAVFYNLSRTQTVALCACFVGPLCGAWILHSLRALLSPPSESLLNNVNLSVYAIVAMWRPFALVCRLERNRISHLQSIAYPEGRPQVFTKNDIHELSQRIDTIEQNLANVLSSAEDKDTNSQVGIYVRQAMQPQLDALNRAVRRYEKRSVVQTMQTEARLNDLEERVKDALSLAAAVARNGQNSSVFSRLFEWITGVFVSITRSVWAIVTYPAYLARQCGKAISYWIPSRPTSQAPKRKGKNK